MKIAVTGAAGHVGAAICRELIEQGHEVIALVFNDLRALKGLPVKTVKGNVLDRNSLKVLMQDCDAVFHTAGVIELGYKHIQSVYDINVKGTQNVLETAKECGVKKIVHFSSIHAYDHSPHDQPLDEKRHFVGEISIFYDQTKRDGHILAQEAAKNGQHVVIVCPTSVVGPYDYKPSKLGKAVIDISKGSVPSAVKGGFDFVDVRDIAKGAILALEKGENGTTYILGGKYHSIKSFSEYVLRANGSRKKMLELPLFMAYIGVPFIQLYAKITGKPPLYDKTYIDILADGNKQTLSDKAKNELGYTPRDLEVSLTDTVSWFKAENKI